MLILSFLLFISGIVATVKFFYESKLMTKEIVVNGIKVVDAEDYDIVYWESNERKK